MVAEVIEGIQREQRRYELAVRLIAHQVRTRTISKITAVSRHQLAVLRQRLGVGEEMRRRGPPPSSLQIFTHSARGRTEGAVLAYYCRMSNALLRPGATKTALSLEFGERLCDAYEAYRACVPDPLVDLEELLALVLGLAKGDVIALSRCSDCQATILIDRLSRRRHKCSFCLEQELAGTPERVAEELLVADGQSAGPESPKTELF
jgi:hypothetical protein